jgi:hypothetical protein
MEGARTVLLIAAFVGLGIAISGIFVFHRKSASESKRERIGGTMLFLGILLALGSCVARHSSLCRELDVELMTADPARIRAITLGPYAPGYASDLLMPDLFAEATRIEDPQVILKLLQELRAPVDASRIPPKSWRCRLDLDLDTRQVCCYVYAAPAGWKRPGTKIVLMSSPSGIKTECRGWRRDSFGTLLEQLAARPPNYH